MFRLTQLSKAFKIDSNPLKSLGSAGVKILRLFYGHLAVIEWTMNSFLFQRVLEENVNESLVENGSYNITEI